MTIELFRYLIFPLRMLSSLRFRSAIVIPGGPTVPDQIEMKPAKIRDQDESDNSQN